MGRAHRIQRKFGYERHIAFGAGKVEVLLGLTMRAKCNCGHKNLATGQTLWCDGHDVIVG